MLNLGFYIAKGPKGDGLYAARTIHPGEEILRLSGPLIDFDGTLALGEREGDALQIGPNLYMHLEEPGVLANHSCSPNAGLVDDLTLVALARIRPHEEICYDYSTSMGDGHWAMDCLCGEPTCRGRILDFNTLPVPLQEHYQQRGIVQGYLRSSTAAAQVTRPRLSVVSGYSSIDAK